MKKIKRFNDDTPYKIIYSPDYDSGEEYESISYGKRSAIRKAEELQREGNHIFSVETAQGKDIWEDFQIGKFTIDGSKRRSNMRRRNDREWVEYGVRDTEYNEYLEPSFSSEDAARGWLENNISAEYDAGDEKWYRTDAKKNRINKQKLNEELAEKKYLNRTLNAWRKSRKKRDGPASKGAAQGVTKSIFGRF